MGSVFCIRDRLLSIHNIRFLTKLMEDMREAIMQDRFGDFHKEFTSKYVWGHGGDKPNKSGSRG